MKKTPILIISFGFLVFVLLIGGSSFASVGGQSPNLPALSFNPLDYLNDDLLKGAARDTGIGTSVPNLNLINMENLSSGDIISMLKAVAVLAINLFLIVVQTVAGILKALLQFLS